MGGAAPPLAAPPRQPSAPRWACSVGRAASALGVGSLGSPAERSRGGGKMDPFTDGEWAARGARAGTGALWGPEGRGQS